MFDAVMTIIWAGGAGLYVWGMTRCLGAVAQRYLPPDGWISDIAVVPIVITSVLVMVITGVFLGELFPVAQVKDLSLEPDAPQEGRPLHGAVDSSGLRSRVHLREESGSSQRSGPSSGPDPGGRADRVTRRRLAVALAALTLLGLVLKLLLIWIPAPDWLSAPIDVVIGFGLMASLVGLHNTA